MKRLFSILLAVAVVSLTVLSCKDDFNEEDFLRLQSNLRLQQDSINRARNQASVDAQSAEQAQAQVDALNQAGDLMSVSILVRQNGVGVPGVTVTLTSGTPDATIAGGRTATSTTAVTGATGVADFARATIAPSTITLSLANFVTASAVVDFGSPGNPTAISTTVNGQTKTTYNPPPKVNHALILPFFAKTGATTGTIKGTIRIQTNTTNNTTEFPQGPITVAADYTNLVTSTSSNGDLDGSVTVLSYRFDDGAFGSSPVSVADGTYSMTVPASTSGATVQLVIPTIEVNQRIAANSLDGVPFAGGPQYLDAPAIFGPNAAGFAAIPTVDGARAVFSAPPAPGAGLSFTLAPRPRSLGTWTQGTAGITLPFTQGNVVYQMTSRGTTTMTASPVITVAGNGAGAQMRASLQGTYTGLTISNGGVGYVDGELINVAFNFKDNTSPTPVARNIFNYSPTITAAGGVITAVQGLTQAFATSGITNGYDITSFEVVITGGSGTTAATATPVFTSEVESLQMNSGGSNYTTVTGVTFASGGATVAVREVQNQWLISAPVTTATYSVMPFDLDYEVTNSGAVTTNDGLTDQNGGTSTLPGALRISGTAIIFLDVTKTWRTTSFSAVSPKIIEVQQPAVQAKAPVTVGTDGKVSGLNTAAGPNFSSGDGYSTPLTVSIVPTIAAIGTFPVSPGTGAVVTLTGIAFNAATGEYQWATGQTTLNGGSAYLQNLNQFTTSGTAPAAPSVVVKSGQTYTIDYNYLGGFRKINLQ